MIDERVVSKEEGMKCARKHHMMFIEASAKTKEGVACAFEELVEKIIQTPALWEKSDVKKGVQLDKSTDQGQGSGCQGYCVIWTFENYDCDKLIFYMKENIHPVKYWILKHVLICSTYFCLNVIGNKFLDRIDYSDDNNFSEIIAQINTFLDPVVTHFL